MTADAGDILVGIAAVVLGCLAGSIAVEASRRTGNWLFLVTAVGAVAFVAGVVGQRSWPSEDSVRRLGQDAASSQLPGPWDAGVRLPLLGVHVTPVALGGLVVAIAGVSLVLLFEAVPERRREPPAGLPVEERDTV